MSTARPPRPTIRGSVIDVDLTARTADVDGHPVPIDHHPTPAAAALAHVAQLAAQAGHPLCARFTNHDAHTSIPLVIDPTGCHSLDLDDPPTSDWEGGR